MFPKLISELVVQNSQHRNIKKGGQVPRFGHEVYFTQIILNNYTGDDYKWAYFSDMMGNKNFSI